MNMTRSTHPAGNFSTAVAHQAATGPQPTTGRVSAYLKYPGRSFVHVEADLSCDWGRAPGSPNARTERPVFG